MDGNKRVNMLYDKIRDILKLPNSKERNEKIGLLLGELSAHCSISLSNSKNPGFAIRTYFAGFTAIALMLGASSEESVENQMSMIIKTIVMCTRAISHEERKDGSKEEEESGTTKGSL